MVHDLVPRLRGQVVGRRHVREEGELERGVVAQRLHHLEQMLAVDEDRRHVGARRRFDRGVGLPMTEQVDDGFGAHALIRDVSILRWSWTMP